MSDDRTGSSQTSSRHTACSSLGADGIRREDAPAPFNGPEPPGGAETNGIDRRGAEIVTLTEEQAAVELEEGRSPVEEAGREVEGVEDEELGSTVEEGEEAALALDVPPTESDLPWLPVVQESVVHTQDAGHVPCKSQDKGSNNIPGPEEASDSIALHPASDCSTTEEWDIHCRSGQSGTCHNDNLA